MWRVRGVRGATTIEENTVAAIEEAVLELTTSLALCNSISPVEIVSVTFSVTADIDAAFPARFARSRSGWEHVPLLDVQHMGVCDGLPRCIRMLMHVNTLLSQHEIKHIYLRRAQVLRPDIDSNELPHPAARGRGFSNPI